MRVHETVLAIATACAICCSSPSAGQVASSLNAPQSVADVLTAYASASGGPALAAIRAETRTGTLMRGVTGRVPLEITSQAPGRWRYLQAFAWGDQVCFGCDGEAAWIRDGQEITPQSDAQRRDLSLLFDLHAPLHLERLYTEMTVAGSESTGDHAATLVRAVAADGSVTELAFDQTSGLLLRAGEMRLEDYRMVDGVQRPFRVLLGPEGDADHPPMRMEFAEICHPAPADDALFRQPECPLAPRDSPLYARRAQVAVPAAVLEACTGVYKDQNDSTRVYTVTRQGEHLMLQRAGWPQPIEVKPESELDYFVRFLNFEFHFVKDADGTITQLEIGADRRIKAHRVR